MRHPLALPHVFFALTLISVPAAAQPARPTLVDAINKEVEAFNKLSDQVVRGKVEAERGLKEVNRALERTTDAGERAQLQEARSKFETARDVADRKLQMVRGGRGVAEREIGESWRSAAEKLFDLQAYIDTIRYVGPQNEMPVDVRTFLSSRLEGAKTQAMVTNADLLAQFMADLATGTTQLIAEMTMTDQAYRIATGEDILGNEADRLRAAADLLLAYLTGKAIVRLNQPVRRTVPGNTGARPRPGGGGTRTGAPDAPSGPGSPSRPAGGAGDRTATGNRGGGADPATAKTQQLTPEQQGIKPTSPQSGERGGASPSTSATQVEPAGTPSAPGPRIDPPSREMLARIFDKATRTNQRAQYEAAVREGVPKVESLRNASPEEILRARLRNAGVAEVPLAEANRILGISTRAHRGTLTPEDLEWIARNNRDLDAYTIRGTVTKEGFTPVLTLEDVARMRQALNAPPSAPGGSGPYPAPPRGGAPAAGERTATGGGGGATNTDPATAPTQILPGGGAPGAGGRTATGGGGGATYTDPATAPTQILPGGGAPGAGGRTATGGGGGATNVDPATAPTQILPGGGVPTGSGPYLVPPGGRAPAPAGGRTATGGTGTASGGTGTATSPTGPGLSIPVPPPGTLVPPDRTATGTPPADPKPGTQIPPGLRDAPTGSGPYLVPPGGRVPAGAGERTATGGAGTGGSSTGTSPAGPGLSIPAPPPGTPLPPDRAATGSGRDKPDDPADEVTFDDIVRAVKKEFGDPMIRSGPTGPGIDRPPDPDEPPRRTATGLGGGAPAGPPPGSGNPPGSNEIPPPPKPEEKKESDRTPTGNRGDDRRAAAGGSNTVGVVGLGGGGGVPPIDMTLEPYDELEEAYLTPGPDEEPYLPGGFVVTDPGGLPFDPPIIDIGPIDPGPQLIAIESVLQDVSRPYAPLNDARRGESPDFVRALFGWLRAPRQATLTHVARAAQRHESHRGFVSFAVADQPAGRSQRQGGPSDRVVLSIVATGASTGEVFELQIVNGTGKDLRLASTDGLVLQALAPGAAKPLAARTKAPVQRKPVLGYCLEFAKNPPTPGTLYQLAEAKLQEKFKPARKIFQVVRKLSDAGLLAPDAGEKKDYLGFIKQWALWTKLENWNVAKFEQMFVERTKKNLAQVKRPWTKEIEQFVRASVPKRWSDIMAVLERAGATGGD